MIMELVIGVVGSLIAAEAYVWAPALSAWMIRMAAARLPRMNDRMQEQWEADLQEIPGHLAKIAFAAGLIVRWRSIVGSLPAEEKNAQVIELDAHIAGSTVLSAVLTSTGAGGLSGTMEGWESTLSSAVAYGRSDSTMRRHAAFLMTITPPPICLIDADENKGESS